MNQKNDEETKCIYSEEEINILIAQQALLTSGHIKLIARIEDEMSEMIKKGSKAWADVPNAAEIIAARIAHNHELGKAVDLFIAENNFGDEEMMRKILVRFLDFISREE